jgi:mRNA interferase HigB
MQKKHLKLGFQRLMKLTGNPPQDIKNRYRSADFLADNRVIFNIKGNHYRLVVRVKYQNGIAVIEWVGTHSEYDKQRF